MPNSYTCISNKNGLLLKYHIDDTKDNLSPKELIMDENNSLTQDLIVGQRSLKIGFKFRSQNEMPKNFNIKISCHTDCVFNFEVLEEIACRLLDGNNDAVPEVTKCT